MEKSHHFPWEKDINSASPEARRAGGRTVLAPVQPDELDAVIAYLGVGGCGEPCRLVCCKKKIGCLCGGKMIFHIFS